jgi:hypothetical protein
MTMPIESVPDWEKRLARQDAFWSGSILDRPVVVMTLHRPHPDFPWPAPKTYASVRDRWMDSGYRAEQALASVMNTEYLGDALPTACPNLGPEIFSAFFGCQLEFSEQTSWSIPLLHDWNQADDLQFSETNEYFLKMEEITDALLAAGRNRFYTGITDLHPGGDAIVAFRDPLNMNMDMIDHPEAIKTLLAKVNAAYLRVFDHYCDKLEKAGQAITSWPGIVSTRRWYVPSNDFSCMISKEMFDDVFLAGIAEECRHTEASIYHLDGPGALQHLDSLLAIKELNAIQWVYGAGHGRATDWLPVYRRCQAAGKGLQIDIQADELETLMANLRPEGIWLRVGGVASREQGEAVLRRVSQWR